MENRYLGKKVILEDKRQNNLKRLHLYFDNKEKVWFYGSSLLNKDTLELTLIPSGAISHQTMCELVLMFHEITDGVIDVEKYNHPIEDVGI